MKNYRRYLAVVLALSLTGCGFQPLYGSKSNGGSGADAALNDVAIANIPDREGQMLRNRLIDRMYHDGRPENPHYRLEITLQESETALGIRRDATASRTRVDLTAHYVLRQISDNKALIDTTAKTSVSFNQLDAQYATLTSREDAKERALNEVGEQIVNRLALYFGTQNQTGQ